MTVGDLWRWGMKDEELHKDMDKAWRQLVRWLVADVPNQIQLAVEPRRGDPNQAVTLNLRARDKKFLPLDNATVAVSVRYAGQTSDANTNVIRVAAEPSLTEAGLYTAMFVPRDTGGYQAEAVVTGPDNIEAGRAEAGWTSDPAAEEFRSLKPNRALLETIAKKTGGEIIEASKLEEFAKSLPNRKVPVTEAMTVPLWHQASVFLFALICFVAEWGLRRWKGMV